MIELNDIKFSYTKKGSPALDGITAVIPPGIHLLAGENGAGKTTLLHLIGGLAKPTQGTCTIDGTSCSGETPEDMKRVFLLEENQFFPGGTINKFAEMHSHFYPGFSKELFQSNLEAFGLSGDEKFSKLSLGNRKKSQLAYVLSLGIDVLLLDEPTNALDIQGRDTFRRILASSLRDDQTVLISTHSVTDLENLYDGAVILTRSRLLLAATEDALSSRLSFEVSRVPQEDAIYSEIQVGRVMNILPVIEGEEPTRVNWRLLYLALNSPKRNDLLNHLLKNPTN